MDSPITVRSATQEDIQAIVNFGQIVLLETYLHWTSQDYVQSMLQRWWNETYFEGVIGSGNVVLLIVENKDDNPLIGLAEVQISQEEATLWKLYLHANWRGKGIGSRLIEQIKEILIPTVKDLRTVYLSLNKMAGQFFLKRGFRFEHLDEDQRDSRFSYTWLSMRLNNASKEEIVSQHPSAERHRSLAADLGSIPLAIVTVSDTRSLQTDTNGRFLVEQIASMGNFVTAHRIVKDEPEQIQVVLDELCSTAARIIIFNGGTGISSRDTTYDVIQSKLTKTLPGFGELFRMLSYEQVGAAAMLSRATAGIYRGKVIISLPGSPNAVQLAWEKLIAPEVQHLAWEVAR
jgi:molybdenum cofactor biosynthesis protein B